MSMRSEINLNVLKVVLRDGSRDGQSFCRDEDASFDFVRRLVCPSLFICALLPRSSCLVFSTADAIFAAGVVTAVLQLFDL